MSAIETSSLPEPYYQDDNRCECGCGERVTNRFVSGHNLKGLKRTEAHSRKIGEAQRRAWQTKRKRLPIGSKNHDHHGYVRVKVLEGAGQWRKEHHLVMEQMIGRRLTSSEMVHHINGDRADNRPENLFLCENNSHHQRVEHSLVEVFREFLADGLAVFNRETERYERA